MNKRLKIILIITGILILLGMKNVFATNGSFSINKNSVAINVGETTTFSITATNCAGKFTVTSSNASVATVNTNSEWIENASKEIKITAKSAGTATITIKADDVASTDENEVTGSKTIQVTVSEKVTNNNGNSNSGGVDNTQKPVVKSTEAKLKTLGIRPNDFSGFSKNRNKEDWSVEVPNSVTEVEVYATAMSDKAKVEGTGKISLKEGNNIAKIKVTAEAGNTKTYTLNVTRKEAEKVIGTTEEKLGLSTLSIEGIDINPSFKSNIYEYTATIKAVMVEDFLNITAKANDENATVEIIGNDNIQDGENVITILVNNETTKENATYQIIVDKQVELEIVEKTSWLRPLTWGKEEIIKVTIILILIILIVWAIILKVKLSKESEKRKLPGAEELDKAITEHQELSEEPNYIEDIAENRFSEYEDEDFIGEKAKRKGRHF